MIIFHGSHSYCAPLNIEQLLKNLRALFMYVASINEYDSGNIHTVIVGQAFVLVSHFW